MKKIFLHIVVCLFSVGLKSQNLVPNWSFEDYNQCSDNWDQLYRVNNWTKYNGGSPDYWNACDTSMIAGVPNNLAGIQIPATGNAYVGIVMYSLVGGNINSYREFLGSQLKTPLMPSATYFVSLKLSPTIRDTSISQFKYVCNNQCVLFTTSPYSQSNPLPISNFAQLVNSTVITDTAGWTTLRWKFIADSSYEYIVIGNFFNDSLTTGILINPTGCVQFSNYYIDDVCVSNDSMTCETLTGIQEQSWQNEVNVYPNPCYNELTVEIKNTPDSSVSESIYDLYGRLILKKILPFKNKRSSIDTGRLKTGMYLLLLQTKIESKKLVFIKN